MKTMCPPSYHHNGFVATHALWSIMTASRTIMCNIAHHAHKCIYIYIYIYILLELHIGKEETKLMHAA